MSEFIQVIYDEPKKTAIYTCSDGSRFLKVGGTTAWRFNNPGNVGFVPFTRNLPGCIGSAVVHNPNKHELAVYSTYAFGRNALKAVLKRTYGERDIYYTMGKYASKRDGNDPKKYADTICKETGIKKDTLIKDMDDSTLEKVMDSIHKAEGYIKGKDIPVNTTNITVSDGTRTVPNYPFKVTLGTTTHEWVTNAVGKLPTIFHADDGMKIEVKVKRLSGQEETVYKAVTDDKTKNVLVTKSFLQYSANTFVDKPRQPREKSQPEPLTYIVKPDDTTLDSIAIRLNVSTSELAKDNGMTETNKTFPGQKLIIHHRQGTIVDQSENKPAKQTGESFPVPAYPSVADIVVKKMPNERVATVAGRSNGSALGLLPLNQSDAPWMEIAYQEADERWHWGRVTERNGGINYHILTEVKIPTMVGDLNAWCASFINYCLQETGYAVSGSANSQSFSNSRNFVKIDIPIYGAIAVFHKKRTKQSGHTSMVYCKTKDGEIGVLGGNQRDSVTINPMNAVYLDSPPRGLDFEFIGYYVPFSYKGRADEIIQAGGDLIATYSNINEVRRAIGSSHVTISDRRSR